MSPTPRTHGSWLIRTVVLIVLTGVAGLRAEETSSRAEGEHPPASQPAEAPGPTETPLDRPFSLDGRTLTGDWLGLRPALHGAGIDAHLFWNTQFFSVMGGGLETDSGKFSHTHDVLLTFDLEQMGLIEGADALVHARQQWGASVNRWVGGQQVNDDADGDRGFYVDQLWYRQSWLAGKIALQLGYLDYQTIVDRNAYANSEDKQFMNAALDNNPIIPTASMAGLGAALYLRPCDWYTLIVGAGDAQRLPLYKPGFSTTFHDEAWFLGYLEQDLHVKIPTERGPLTGNYRVGMVYDPTPRTMFDNPVGSPEQRDDDVGLYVSLDQMLLRESEADAQGLGVFFRYGYHHDDVYRFSRFWSAGAVYTGLLPDRDRDVLGFAAAQLVDSGAYREQVNPDSGNETLYELYYAIRLTPWLVLTPDIQYVDNPGGNDNVSHTIAGGLRVRISF